MADIIVNWHIELPGGGPPAVGAVTVELVSSTGTGFLTGTEVLGIQTTRLDGNGNTSLTITPNIGSGAITTPATTYYRVIEYVDGMRSTYYIRVDGSGSASVNVSAILYTP